MKKLVQKKGKSASSTLVKIETLTAKQKRINGPGSWTEHCNRDCNGYQ